MLEKMIDQIKFANSGPLMYLHIVAKKSVKSLDHARLLISPYISGTDVCKDPCFIISCGRSGSTLLFRLLSKSSKLKSLYRENPILSYHMRKVVHKHNLFNYKLTEADANDEAVDFCKKAYYSYYRKHRFLDKLPDQCYQIRFLHNVFPKAKFIFLYRGPLVNINSWMNAWKHKRFLGKEVPFKLRIKGYDGKNWVGPFFDNWQEYIDSSLEEVCAQQWISTHETMLEDKEYIPIENRYEVSYETLISKPVATISEICDFLEIPLEGVLLESAKRLDNINSVTPPSPDKWQHENPGISKIIPVVKETEENIKKSLAEFRTHSMRSSSKNVM